METIRFQTNMEMTEELVSKIRAQKDRLLDVPGVRGFRDIGGGAIKKGVVYRSGEICDIKDAGKDIVINKLHIKTEIDLRGSGMHSVLHPYLNDHHFDCPEYIGEYFMGIDSKEAIVKRNIVDIFTAFSEKESQPFLIHCEIGRDRVGTICFLLESLLGESEEDMIIDYGLSFFVPRAYGGEIDRFYDESFHPLMDYIKGTSFQLHYLETSKDNYEQQSFYDVDSALDMTTDEGKAEKSTIETLVASHLPELNSTFDTLIKEKAGLTYSFYDGLAVDHYTGSKRLNTLSLLSMFLIVMGTILIAANLFFLAFCFIYGRKKNESPFYKLKISNDVLSRGPHAKKDFFFGPFIPETVYEIVGIIFVFFGSLRILYYFFTFIGAITISGNDFSIIPQTFFYLFMIGMFLLYFIDFDIFLDDKRVFRNIVLYFLIFVVLYVFETIFMSYLSNSNVLLLKELGSNLSIPNNFGTITCYFVMMMTLFYTPKNIKTHKGEVCYRLLTIIPVLIIIINTLIYHYANTRWGWNLSIPVLYLFSSERTQFSLLCVIYLLGLYFLKLFYEKKYGKEKAIALMGCNRFLLLKNSIVALTVLFIGILEIAFLNNNAAHELGLGKYPNITWLAPALLFYHPHKGERSAATDWATLIFYVLSFAGGYILIALPFLLIIFASL